MLPEPAIIGILPFVYVTVFVINFIYSSSFNVGDSPVVPAIIIAFNNLYPFKDNIASIETHGITKEFAFNKVEEFLEYIFSINKNQLLAYYNQMGYLGIDSKDYYKKRIKLKKYYKKLK